MSRADRVGRSRAHDLSALSTSIGVALTLSLLGGLVAGALLVRELKADWMSALRVQVILSEVPAGAEEVEALKERWLQYSAVGSVDYLDPEMEAVALERELGEPFMDFLGSSPLPAVMELTLDKGWMQEFGLDGLSLKTAEWMAKQGVERVEYPEALLGRLERGFDEWAYPGLVAVAVLMFIVFAQISNVVRLSVFGRRFLIRSMELVGAPPRRIRTPFIAEAMGYGVVGAMLAYAIVVFGLSGLRSMLPDTLGAWEWGQLVTILAVQLAVGLVLTGVSAGWAVSRYLGARLDRLV